MAVNVWDVLGAVGAATGVPALGWEIWAWKHSGPRIVIQTANAFPVFGGQTGTHHFQVTVINKGRSEGTVTTWGLQAPERIKSRRHAAASMERSAGSDRRPRSSHLLCGSRSSNSAVCDALFRGERTRPVGATGHGQEDYGAATTFQRLVP